MGIDRRSHLTPVDAGPVADYPIPRDERLPELSWIKWYPTRWLFSAAHLNCSYEVQGIIRALYDLSIVQSPIGTLPDSDEELARLLRIDLVHWRSLRKMGDTGPLRGWFRANCEGELRLAHAVVLSGLQDILERREAREASQSAAAERKRLDRLADAMRARKFSAEVVGDLVLVRRIDDWLLQNGGRKRTELVLDRVFTHAQHQGWMAGPGRFSGRAD